MAPELLYKQEHYTMFNCYKSTLYATSTGIPQGSPLSPILDLFYSADLVNTCNSEPNTKALGYVDDIGVLTWSKFTKENRKILEMIHHKTQV